MEQLDVRIVSSNLCGCHGHGFGEGAETRLDK